MALELPLEPLQEAFRRAQTTIQEHRRGLPGAFSWLVSQTQDFARLADSNELTRIFILLGVYHRMLDIALESRLTDGYRARLANSIEVPDLENPHKTVPTDLSPELRWVGMAYRDFTGLFGDHSADFYYVEARRKLVPEYVDERYLPVVARVLIDSYGEAVKEIRELVLAMLHDVEDAIEAGDIAHAAALIMDHILVLHREAYEWPG